jgi:PAS domain S-box-containing protein
MNTTESFLKAHKKILVDTAIETLLTSGWIPQPEISESTSRKIFSDIFSQIDKDLFSQVKESGFQLSRFYLDLFHNNPDLKQNFYAQLAYLGISRIVLNHYFIHRLSEESGNFQTILERIQKIFDFTLISLSQAWGEMYKDIREKDLQLIRELRLVKNDLQKQLNVIYQIMKESPIATVNCDEHFSIVQWNPAAMRLTSYAPADIMKKNILGIFTSASRERLKNRLNSDRKRVSNLRLYIQPKIGNPLPTIVSVSKIKFPSSADIHYLFNLQEINAGYAGIEKSKQKLNQLMTITRLSSAIMHDIRNPLNAIGLNVEILEQHFQQQSFENNSAARELLRKVQKEIQQLSQNLNQYLAYGHLTELYLEPINFSAKFRTFLEDINLEASLKKVKINFNGDAKDRWVSADWLQLNRVFMNIMNNAFDAAGSSGNIDVTMRGRGRRVSVSFWDNGPGIPPSLRGKVFEPFFSTKKTGTGLGLFIAREIVKAHGGRISYRPAQIGGSIFSLSFPCIDDGKENKHV